MSFLGKGTLLIGSKTGKSTDALDFLFSIDRTVRWRRKTSILQSQKLSPPVLMLLTKKDINTSLAEALAASSNAVERKIQQLQSQLELAYQKSANDSNTIQNLQEQLKATKIDYSTTIKVLEAQRKAS
jgi:hypothetical protein